MDLDAALQQHFGFSGFRAGQHEACQAALADRDVLVVMPTGSGKSLCYQLPGLMRADLTVVVSPLVALMQDQVEALHARGVGDQVALVNAQQDQATNAGVMQRAADGIAAAAVRLAGAVRLARLPGPDAVGRHRAVRGRRGALRVAVGPRLPARLLPPGRRRPPPRGQGHRGLHGHGHAAGGGGHRPPARAARAAEGGHGLRPPEPLVRRRPAGAAREAPADRRGAGGRGRAAGHRLRGHARGRGGDRRAAHRAAGRARRGLPRRPGPRAAGGGAAPLPHRRGARDRGHQRVRHGRRQGQRAHGAARQRAVVARGLLPGGRPRGPRRPARPRAAAGREPRQGAARALHQARGGRPPASGRAGRPADGRGRRRRALPDRHRASWPASPAAASTACARCWATSPARA